jgi:hypothetical protein
MDKIQNLANKERDSNRKNPGDGPAGGGILPW